MLQLEALDAAVWSVLRTFHQLRQLGDIDGDALRLVAHLNAFTHPGRLKNKLSLIVPRIVLLVVPKTSATVWVLILLFGTPTATTTLLTTLAAFVTTLV